MTTHEEITVLEAPFPKDEPKGVQDLDVSVGEDGAKVEKVHLYENHPMYMGTFMHLGLERELTGDSRPAMPEYVEHLNKIEIGDAISEKVAEVKVEIASQLRNLAPEGFKEPIYFTELSFMPSADQVDVLSKSLKDQVLLGFIESSGYATLNDFIKAALTGDELVKTGSSSRTWQEIYAVSRNSKAYDETIDPETKVCKLLSAVSTYYYLDLETPRPNSRIDLTEIRDSLKKVVLSASARPDFIGLMPSEDIDASEEKVIEEFREVIKGRFFGTKPMHEIGAFTEEEAETVMKLLSMITTKPPKVALQIGEIKTQIQTVSVDDQGFYQKVEFKPDEVGKFYYQDISHTNFAMYQFFSRMLNYADVDPSEYGGINPKAMLSIMHAAETYEKEKELMQFFYPEKSVTTIQMDARDTLRQLYYAFKPVKELQNPPTEYVLVRMFYPIYDPRDFMYDEGFSKEAIAKPIQYKVDVLDPRTINVETQNIAEGFVRRLSRPAK